MVCNLKDVNRWILDAYGLFMLNDYKVFKLNSKGFT